MVVLHPVCCTIFSVREFVLLCSHHLTIFFLFSIQLLRQHKEVQCLHHALCSARLASGLYTSYNEHFQSNLSKSIIQRRLITLSSKHIFHSFFHISFIFTFLFESYYPNILTHTSIFSSILIYHQPNHLRLVFIPFFTHPFQ